MVTDIKKYKQEKKKQKSRTVFSRILIFLVKFLIVTGIFLALILYVPIFKVADAQISGLYYLEKNALDTQLDEIRGKNIVFLNKNEIKASFKTNSYVKEVELKRKFPNKIMVEITERKPLALLVTSDGFIQVSQEAIFLDIRQSPGKYDLPFITGIELYAIPGVGKVIEDDYLKEALHIISSSKGALMNKIAEINVDNKRIIAYTRNGIQVLIGDSADIDNKLKMLESIIEEIVDVSISLSEIDYIDLRFKDSYVIKKK